MYAYQLHNVDTPIQLVEQPIPRTQRNGVVVKILATPLLSYSALYLQGKLPYMMPPMPFTPGTNAIGIVHEVGPGVQHVHVGQRVMVSSHWMRDEPVQSPEQALLGLTGISEHSGEMLKEYPHGTWREYADFPAALIHPLEGLDHYDAVSLTALSKIMIPFGGLRRAALQAGETVIINGAAGYFGSGAVLGALALGANVVATGRNEAALQAMKAALGPVGERVKIVVQKADEASDIAALKTASEGGAHAALCMVGQANDAHSTAVTLQSLRRNGRLVLMGSLLPSLSINYGQMLLNNWEIKGNFMYSRQDVLLLTELVKNGLVDLKRVQTQSFHFQELEKALAAAAKLKGLESVVLQFPGNT